MEPGGGSLAGGAERNKESPQRKPRFHVEMEAAAGRARGLSPETLASLAPASPVSRTIS